MRSFSVLLVLFYLAPLMADGGARLDQMSWLEGCWDGDSDTRQFEECWSEPAGGLMIGYGRSIGASGQAGFEYLRLIERSGEVFYLAQPGGGEATEFRAARIGPGFARFINPDHDDPRVIEYRREGDRLTAMIGDGLTIDESSSVNEFPFVLRDD